VAFSGFDGADTERTVLRLAPADEDALQTKLFLLLRTDQYDSALDLISARPDVSEHAFEQAYSLYRLHRELEAREILSTIRNEETEHRGALHLEAQLVGVCNFRPQCR
jgi:signal recognition particle subunit SRP72